MVWIVLLCLYAGFTWGAMFEVLLDALDDGLLRDGNWQDALRWVFAPVVVPYNLGRFMFQLLFSK